MKHIARTLTPLVLLLAAAATHAATQDRPTFPARLDVLDFEGMPAGTILEQVVGRHGTGPVGVHGTNPDLGAPNAALAFDSSSPTGGDDDLGTPNTDFGGPGVGEGGENGSPFANRRALGNLLIVGDDLTDANNDGLVDDPGDTNAFGAQLFLDFSALGGINPRSITVVDVEKTGPSSTIEMLDSLGNVLGTVDLPVVGNNGVAVVDLSAARGVYEVVITLSGSAAVDNLYYSLDARGAVGGRVWNDLDEDGLEEDGEPGLAGVTLTLDSPTSGAFSAVTNEFGRYRFLSVPAGDWVLAVDEATLPEGAMPSPCDVGGDDTIDSDCSPLLLSVAPGAVATNVDFGYGFGPDCDGRIGDFVFDDLNGDNVQDAGDVGIAGATLFLHDDQGNHLATTVSDAGGMYEFTGLCEGEYVVSIDITTATNFLGVVRGPALCDIGDDSVDSECGPECVGLGLFLSSDVEEDITVDWGYRECGDCDGKLDGLSLRYHGALDPAFVEVYQKDGTLVFAGELHPEDDFSFVGMDNQNTFGPWIDIYVEGQFHATLHTSCSQPVTLGMMVGDFEVLAGSSRHGGALCPEDGQ